MGMTFSRPVAAEVLLAAASVSPCGVEFALGAVGKRALAPGVLNFSGD
jgi:hypothetical protein